MFIYYDAEGGPTIQRNIVIWTSAGGKVALAGAHIGFSYWFQDFFRGSAPPNWAVFFLAAQGWWDFMLIVVYSCLRGDLVTHNSQS